MEKSVLEFINFVNEREAIRMLKESGAVKPWSDDPVMQTTYFCNIRREDDKTTKWIRKHWGAQRPNYELAMLTARIFNYPPTLREIERPWDDLTLWFEHLSTTLGMLADDHKQIWSGAYIISTNGRHIDKAQHCVELLWAAAKALPCAPLQGTLTAAHRRLQGLYGVGSFLAAQVVADLKNTTWHPLAKAEDWWTFCAHGPGSIRGLSWYTGRKVTPATFRIAIDTAAKEVEGYIPKLCMQDLQNCFCEFDKYMRVKHGTGKSKRKYES